jgi:hypothetical protein
MQRLLDCPKADFCRRNDLHVNGGVRHKHTLSADAQAFQPITAGRSPVSLLNTYSEDDETLTAPRLPVIVSSVPQQPIGTRSSNSPAAQPQVFFTTDFGPSIKFQGSHYFKVVMPKGAGPIWTELNEKVSCKMRIVVHS